MTENDPVETDGVMSMTTSSIPEPMHANWERVRTPSGWHLRLKGANGEIVLVSEVYEDPRSAFDALVVALRANTKYLQPTVSSASTAASEILTDVDER